MNCLPSLMPAAVFEDDVAQGRTHLRLDESRGRHVTQDRVDLGAGALRRSVPSEPVCAVLHNLGYVCKGLHVIDDGRLAPQTGNNRVGRLVPRMAPVSLEGLDEGRFLAAHIRPRALHDRDVEAEGFVEDVAPEEAERTGVGDGLFRPLYGKGVFPPVCRRSPRVAPTA